MTHDALCPQQPRSDGATLTMLDSTPIYCACDLIANVREDERKGIIGSVELAAIGQANQQTYLNGQRDMLAKCIAELEALMAKTDGDRFHGFWDSIAALRALQGKPTPPPLPPSQGIPEKRGSLRRTKKDGKP